MRGGTVSIGAGNQAGTLTVNGDFIEEAGTTLTVCIGSGAAASLVVNGNATLAGTINTQLPNGYEPDPDVPDTFQVITCETYQGSFYNQTIDLGNGLMCAVHAEQLGVALVAQRDN